MYESTDRPMKTLDEVPPMSGPLAGGCLSGKTVGHDGPMYDEGPPTPHEQILGLRGPTKLVVPLDAALRNAMRELNLLLPHGRGTPDGLVISVQAKLVKDLCNRLADVARNVETIEQMSKVAVR